MSVNHTQGVFAWQFWGLSQINAGALKVKLAIAIVGISSIHLLKTFINAPNYDEKTPMWQTLHIAFPASAHTITFTEKITAAQHS